ncbi:PriCT-2 domain-containing protein [Methylobacterium sp. NPDC080182]|uniref:PriCT-2 domain-containing protein n=1 Tax=Methylobacterium sp. NPDC080182 TaxID=3390590 RepID=UPI003D05DBA8
MSAATSFNDLARARNALFAISPDLPRPEWIRVGMAAKSAGLDLDDFDTWSALGHQYVAADVRVAWRSFRTEGAVGAGTLFHAAREAGWRDDAARRPKLTQAEIEAAENRRAERAAADLAEQEAEEARAAERAQAIWNAALPVAQHPYLARKGVRAHGARFAAEWVKEWTDRDGQVRQAKYRDALLVPIMSGPKQVASLQAIFPTKCIGPKDARRDKDYLAGGRKRGCYFIIGRVKAGEPVVVLCEGFATGASIHEATGLPVMVCFDAGNLSAVASALRDKLPEARIILAADNDVHSPGIPGLDIGGSASLLVRVNASLSAGGAKGEASQFFTGGIGASLGLNPYQTRMWREQGAFGTLGQSFGEGSVYARYKGRAGPGGNTTLLSATLEKLRGQYVDGSDELADAAANHLGIGVNQAMALLSVKPNQMGEMQAYAKDLTKLSGGGILNMSKALYGSAGDRSALASEFLGRTGSDAIGADDAKAIRAAQSGGNDDELKRVLASVASKYDQERTLGSDIRDSKSLLENLKTKIADELVPYTKDIRMGFLHLAGKGEKTGDEVLRDIAGMETKDRKGRISNIAKADRDRINADIEKRMGDVAPGISPGDIFKQDWHQEYARKLKDGTATSEEKAAFEKRVGEYQAARLKGINDPEVGKKKRELQEERARLLAKVSKKERADLGAEDENLKKRLREIGAQPLGAPPATPVPGVPAGQPPSGTAAAGGRAFDPMTGTSSGGPLSDKLAAAEQARGLPPGVMSALMKQETGRNTQAYLDDPTRYHYGLNSEGRRIAGHTGRVSTAFGPFGILESTAARPGFGVAPLKDKSLDEQIRFASDYLAARSRAAGGIEGGLAGYGEGARYSREVMARVGRQSDGMRMPEGSASSGTGLRMPGFNVSSDDITVRVVNERGEPIAPPQSIQTRVRQAQAG